MTTPASSSIATDIIRSEAELREIFAQPSKGAVNKQIDHLDDHCEAFIAHAPFLVFATTNPDGSGDASPKGGPPGFVKVLDRHHLAMGELPGNNRLDGYRNVVRDPRVGLLFLIPGVGETLRVNGTAVVARDPAILAKCAIDEKLPKVALVVKTNEVFIHCAKAIRRSHLWDHENWPDTTTMPTVACMLVTHTGAPGDPDGSRTAASLEAAYVKTMWNE